MSSSPDISPERSSLDAKVLVVDDDLGVRRAIETTLRGLGFVVSGSSGAEQAIALLKAVRYDVVMLDIAMPGMDGIEACRELRRVRARIPILMITVHDAEDMVVRALEAGADDYLTKPFRTGELAARLRALIRRSRANDTRSGGVIRVADIQLDAARRTVLKAGTPVRLTPKEFDLLAYLMMNAGFPIPHARLLSAVWGPEYGQEVEYLRTFIRQLRIKLEDNPAEPQYLQTVSHLGYRFREPVEDSASVC